MHTPLNHNRFSQNPQIHHKPNNNLFTNKYLSVSLNDLEVGNKCKNISTVSTNI